MIAHNLGYPRIGSHRELKKACEQYWAGKISHQQLLNAAEQIRKANWLTQQQAGIDLIPCNDFSFYDHVLDMSLTVNAIPERFHPVALKGMTETDLYFAMARGYQKDGLDITAMEMTKWFDTNYHYIVPEFSKGQKFSLFSNRIVTTFVEAKEVLNKVPKPVILGPVSYLLSGKERERGFNRLDLLNDLLPVYEEILHKLSGYGAQWIQFDEPFLVMDLDAKQQQAFSKAYQQLRRAFPHLKLMVATYFECSGSNLPTLTSLPVDAIHLDLVRCPSQLDDVLSTSFIQSKTMLSLGVVDGRNVWINDYEKSLAHLRKAIDRLSEERVMVAPSCSLLHVPCDLDAETNEKVLSAELKTWMAFARQKLYEVTDLKKLAGKEKDADATVRLSKNKAAILSRTTSLLIHRPEIKRRVSALTDQDARRKSPFSQRQKAQQEILKLPLFPTTTIGSFPQTDAIRLNRAKLKKGEKSQQEYEQFIEEETRNVVRWQEEIGLDVLVHGEYERNDMVEYFGELLDGFVFSENGWVQSYGSRCVKPPIIFGDVERKEAMTVRWARFAQSLTKKYVKGMLTGPVTILQWSFVRDDQPRKDTCLQIAFAIRDEVNDLEKAGIRIIQIDEPAIREGLPLRKENWNTYLDWAVKAFRVSASGVKDETQIHTHMCYSEFNDIIRNIADMDADVITIETSRSQMELLDAFAAFQYPNEIGPGVYDIHSPRVPTTREMVDLLQKAAEVLPAKNLWVNPDCGLKTRKWPETETALRNMVKAASEARELIAHPVL